MPDGTESRALSPEDVIASGAIYLGTERNTSLDGLRGIASLSVLFFHFLAVFLPTSVSGMSSISHYEIEKTFYESPIWFLVNADFSVSIFFVLSGYILTTDFFKNKDRIIIYRRSIGRIVRLGIPAGISTLLVAILLNYNLYFIKDASDATGATKFFDIHSMFNFSQTPTSLLSEIFVNPWFRSPDFGRMYNLVLWTMQVEFWGSMMVFLLAAILVEARMKVLIIVALALTLAAAGGTLLTVRLGAFALGSAIAAARMGPGSSRGWIALAATACLLGSYNAVPAFTMPAVCIHCLAAILLLCAVIKSRPLARALSCRPLAYLGRVSFSLYLLHQPVIYSLGSWAFLRTLPVAGYLGAVSVALACVLTTSFLLAHFAEAWIDRPAAALSRTIGSAMVSRLIPTGSVSRS